MIEILNNIKEMVKRNEKEEVIKYIDKVLLENKNASNYIDDLVNDLK